MALPFDPSDPFPLLPKGSHSYSEAREHSRQVDDWLELRVADVEAQIEAGHARRVARPNEPQIWVGFDPQSFLTPYAELREMLAYLEPRPGTKVVDLGAAYGRLGFVLGRHYPEVEFLGYELVAPRVREGARCLEAHGHARARLRVADLASPAFTPETDAEFYFTYDYGTRAAIDKTLDDLRAIARRHPITVVGRGRATRDAIERTQPWLSQVVEPELRGNFSIYRTAGKK